MGQCNNVGLGKDRPSFCGRMAIEPITVLMKSRQASDSPMRQLREAHDPMRDCLAECQQSLFREAGLVQSR